MDASSFEDPEGLIHVSTSLLFISTVPLFIYAFLSSQMGLGLESPMVVGVLRTGCQLTILGAILRPIFFWGIQLWWLVLLYVLFMVTLASLESSARSRYYFQGMFSCILASFLGNVGLVSMFAFGVIIRPHPPWDPQYVIPIVGMLLGNCINAVALSMNAIITSLVEQSQEIELLLSFGASPEEASARLMREAVRVGAMPMLNSMAVIGLISIPGMMTGQILGGAPAMEAARYQMLIIYLICMCAFGTILVEVFVVRIIAFDQHTQMLRTDRFILRETKLSFLGRIAATGTFLRSVWAPTRVEDGTMGETVPLTTMNKNDVEYVTPKGSIEVTTVRSGTPDDGPCSTTTVPNLEIRQVSRSFPANDGGVVRTLFTDVSKTIYTGDIVAVRGPSGVGKSQLLRVIAGLSPMDEHHESDVLLEGLSRNEFKNPAQWRRQVRYVSQYKVDIPGTPRQFIQQVSCLNSWKKHNMPSLDEMVTFSLSLLQNWSLEASCLEKEWKHLSGGEAQRVYVAIAIASRPRVLLLDEATSALDLDTKTRVEDSVELAAQESGISVLWITHDEDQVQRMSHLPMWNRRLSDNDFLGNESR